jgi:hypothetical protein
MFIQIIGQISRLRCASLEMITKWITARHPTCSTLVEDPLQIGPFMQNKANLRNEQMNISSFITSKYENLGIWWIGKNKPNSKPIAGLWPEIRSTKSQILNKFEGSNVQMTKIDSFYHSVPLGLSAFVAMSQFCKTKPIFEKVK